MGIITCMSKTQGKIVGVLRERNGTVPSQNSYSIREAV